MGECRPFHTIRFTGRPSSLFVAETKASTQNIIIITTTKHVLSFLCVDTRLLCYVYPCSKWDNSWQCTKSRQYNRQFASYFSAFCYGLVFLCYTTTLYERLSTYFHYWTISSFLLLFLFVCSFLWKTNQNFHVYTYTYFSYQSHCLKTYIQIALFETSCHVHFIIWNVNAVQ